MYESVIEIREKVDNEENNNNDTLINELTQSGIF